MSFRLFVYYCTICGAWAALVGWLLGLLMVPSEADIARPVLIGVTLGMPVAIGLGLVDTSGGRFAQSLRSVALREFLLGLIGFLSGFLGGAIGQALVEWTRRDLFFLVCWMITGTLIGSSTGFYALILGLFTEKHRVGTWRKLMHGAIGGTIGGLVGGLLYEVLGLLFSRILSRSAEQLLSSKAWGFVTLGGCIGFFIALTQVILRNAWIRVEAGLRSGQELILTKEETTIGRSKSCDIEVFGDPRVDRTHALIITKRDRILLVDARSSEGTFLNEQRIVQPTALHAGDTIRIGICVLRFYERQKSA